MLVRILHYLSITHIYLACLYCRLVKVGGKGVFAECCTSHDKCFMNILRANLPVIVEVIIRVQKNKTNNIKCFFLCHSDSIRLTIS